MYAYVIYPRRNRFGREPGRLVCAREFMTVLLLAVRRPVITTDPMETPRFNCNAESGAHPRTRDDKYDGGAPTTFT